MRAAWEVEGASGVVLIEGGELAPTFSSGEVPTLEEALADREESIDDRDYATFVAERNARLAGQELGGRWMRRC